MRLRMGNLATTRPACRTSPFGDWTHVAFIHDPSGAGGAG